MNILNIDKKVTYSFDDKIEYQRIENSCVEKLIITIKENTNLYININTDNTKLSIDFNILNNVSLNIFKLAKGTNNKIQYVYNLDNLSNLNVFKFNDVTIIKERNIFNLKESSELKYNFKTISTDIEEYDYFINHLGKNSNSYLFTDGVNILNGKLSFNITGEVEKGITNCIVNENSRIINLNDLNCVIKPNLLIDEYNVSANHSSKIGHFNDEELFYLQSRGIDKNKALELLVKGFLMSNLGIFEDKKNVLEEIINKYWR